MADLRDGLDVNSDVGFTAALAGIVGREPTEEELQELRASDRSVASGLEVAEESSQPRDDRGRFAPAAPAAEEQEEAPEATEEEPGVDPALASLLEQHGGDVNAALAAALKERDEAQSLIGRQGNELGELRGTVRELQARFEGFTAAQPQAPQAPSVSFTRDQIESLVEEHGGQAAADYIAGVAPHLFETTLQVWAEQGPWQAAQVARVMGRLGAMELQPQAPAAQSLEPDPWVQEQKQAAAINATLDQIRGGMKAEEWQAISKHLEPSLAGAPAIIQNAIVSTDDATRKQGLEALVQLARGNAIAEAASQARKTEADASVEAKKKAVVISGSQATPVVERQPGAPADREEAIARFKASIKEANTTSVRDGLTFGATR